MPGNTSVAGKVEEQVTRACVIHELCAEDKLRYFFLVHIPASVSLSLDAKGPPFSRVESPISILWCEAFYVCFGLLG